MAKENKTKYAILGVLSLKPASGYDIKKFCDETIAHFWQENYGHIYPVLKQLEEEQWVEKKTEISEGKLKHVYSITARGRERLVEWLSVQPEVTKPRYEFLLKMFFSKDIPAQMVIQRLNESKILCQSILKQYESMEQKIKMGLANKTCLESGWAYRYSTLRYGILDLKAKIAWCDETIALINRVSNQDEEEGL
ncbi:transcription regulator padr n-terminal [Lucifera butyrica]|uniref:Transcription regulator padr n-terminal n=1 Tax=Lucifera butyrica TaxID=1351585 RepID=A0A498R3N0_9FIRM|nr:PadR family transcriptional regulator [Lucifera butyrica]VBB05779.1 transcription regulator padr n-terminal [Lucifera butyrica]